MQRSWLDGSWRGSKRSENGYQTILCYAVGAPLHADHDSVVLDCVPEDVGSAPAVRMRAAWGSITGSCGCRELRPRHATRRYSPTRPPTRACRRTRYCSRLTGSGSGFSGAAPCRDRCGRCRLWWISYRCRIRHRHPHLPHLPAAQPPPAPPRRRAAHPPRNRRSPRRLRGHRQDLVPPVVLSGLALLRTISSIVTILSRSKIGFGR